MLAFSAWAHAFAHFPLLLFFFFFFYFFFFFCFFFAVGVHSSRSQPVHFSFSRNRTFDKWLAGKYRHIRLANMPHNAQPDSAWPEYDLQIAPPTPLGDIFGAVEGGGWKLSDVGRYPCSDGTPAKECGPQVRISPRCSPGPRVAL